MLNSSVIVEVIDHLHIGAGEAKGQSPVRVNPDRPVRDQIALEAVATPAANVHVLRATGCIQPAELQPQPVGMPGLNAGLRACLEEVLQPAMPEASNQGEVYRMAIQD
jgi:hypothetical protein